MVAYVLSKGKQQMSLMSCPSFMKQIISFMYFNVYMELDRDG